MAYAAGLKDTRCIHLPIFPCAPVYTCPFCGVRQRVTLLSVRSHLFDSVIAALEIVWSQQYWSCYDATSPCASEEFQLNERLLALVRKPYKRLFRTRTIGSAVGQQACYDAASMLRVSPGPQHAYTGFTRNMRFLISYRYCQNVVFPFSDQ